MNRRFFLRAGGAVVALPMLESLLPRSAWGQTAQTPRRFISVFTANGDQIAQRFTTRTETGFVLGDFLTPYQSMRGDMLFLEGVNKYHGSLPADERADGHQQGGSALAPWRSGEGSFPIGGVEGAFIGYVKGPSLDKHLGDMVRARDNVRFGNLVYRVGDQSNNIWNNHAHAGPVGTQNPIPPETDPFAAYTRIFADVSPEAREAALHRLAMRQSALDLVKNELASLKLKLSADDVKRLNTHTDSVRDIEQGLTALAGDVPACTTLSLGTKPSNQWPYAAANWDAVGDMFFRILTMAFACDLTRVVNFNWSGNTSGRVYGELGHTDSHHTISHDSSTEAFVKIRAIIQRLHLRTVELLYGALKGVEENGGTVYDNTMVMHWSELAQGDTHSNSDNLVMFGGGGSAKYFRTGRYVKLTNAANGSNSFSDLLVHPFKYMGFNDVNRFGDELLWRGNGAPTGLTW